MSRKEPQILKYIIERVVTEQFAVFAEAYNSKELMTVSSNFKYNFGNKEPVIKVDGRFVFEQQDKVFLKLLLSVVFRIHPEDWEKVYFRDDQKFVLENLTAQHLASIVIGTARGTIHAKTEQGPFAGVILPGISLQEHFKNDIELQMDQSELMESE